MIRILKSLLLCSLAAGAATALAVETEIGPGDDLEVAVAALQPGDVLVLRGGDYVFNENITLRATGTPAAPIVVRAKAGERALLTQATDRQNVIEVRDSAHLILRDLTITGGSHGIRLINSDDLTIENCEIFETGDVALSANSGGTYERLKILRNHIHHTNGTGEGMYLGCNNDGCRIADSLIEGNYVHDTNRPSVAQGDGIEIKEGSYGNIVRDNVIHDTNYPGILTYSTVGNGPPNIIERNVIWNSNDNTMQVAADAIIRNNIILGNVAFQLHQAGTPSNLQFVHNTVINPGAGITIRNVSGPVVIANNAIYSGGTAINLISGDVGQVRFAGNVGVGGVSSNVTGFENGNGIGSDFVNASYAGAPPIDVYPSSGSALLGAGDAQYSAQDDFNGLPRSGPVDAGAYGFSTAANPGWAIAEGFKPQPGQTRPNPPTGLGTD